MGGYVYLICDPGNDWFKIGVTTGKIENRIKELQTGNGSELFIKDYFKCDYPFKLEKMLHAKFMSKRVMNEWFNLTIDDIKQFKETCIKLNETINCLKENPFFIKKGPIRY